MQSFVRALALSALLAPFAAAQSLSHVRLSAPNASALAETLEQEGFDVLEGSVRADALDLVVSAESAALLESRGLKLQLIERGRPYKDIQRELLAASPDAVPAGYSDLATVYARMNAAAAAHPSIAQVVDLNAKYSLPLTHEGRNILAIKISDNVAVDEDEPNALIVSEHHAREITTPEISLLAMQKLVDGYGIDPTITSLVNGHEIWIVPLCNPDGYVYVFNVDNLWRKNRRNNGNGTFGVDINRNYPFQWTGACAGSSVTSNETYKGPSAGSEPEVQVLMKFANDRRFARLVDYHSFGQEVLWGYSTCSTHPFAVSFLQPEAIAFSNASNYGGANRLPSADGEHYEWHLANFMNMANLIETDTTFQPSFANAQAEALKVWPGIPWMLQRPMPISGHVTDAQTSLPLNATIKVLPINFTLGEKNSSGGAFGRYTAYVPPGNYTLQVSAPCYTTQSIPVTSTAGNAVVLDVALQPASVPTLYCTSKPASLPSCVPTLSFSGVPSATAGSGFTVTAGPVPGAKQGLWIHTTQGAAAVPVNNAYGWLCINTSGLFRFEPMVSTGTNGVCNGQLSFDFNTWAATQTQNPSVIAGATVDVQAWYRDPPNPGGANLTNAASFTLCP